MKGRLEIVSRAEVRYYAHNVKGARGRTNRAMAYRDAARRAFTERYPCECEPEVGSWCGNHVHHERPGSTAVFDIYTRGPGVDAGRFGGVCTTADEARAACEKRLRELGFKVAK